MEYIEKTTDFSNKKNLKKYIRSCINYGNIPFVSRIINKRGFIKGLMIVFFVIVFVCCAEMDSGMLSIPIYKTPGFSILLYVIVLFLIIAVNTYVEHRWFKQYFSDSGKFKLFIFHDGIVYCDPDSDDDTVEIAFRDMKDMIVRKNHITYLTLDKSGKRRYQCTIVPAFTLTSIEQFKIRQWYRQQTKVGVTRKKRNRKPLLLIGILLSIIALTITIYSYVKRDTEQEVEKNIKIELETDIMPAEREIINEVNKRKIYRDRCSFYEEVVSYMENVREVRDIGNLLEPIYQTNEIYYTKEDFQNDPPLIIYLAKNEIYARHGYQFKNSDLDNYFRGMVWYKPLYTAEKFDPSVFNDCEQHNLKILRELDTYERN